MGRFEGKSMGHTKSCTFCADLQLSAELVQQAIFSSFHKNCPPNVPLSPGRDPWWNEELRHLNASARWLFNKAKWTGNWESQKIALTNYNKEIRKSKWPSRWNYCGGTEDVPDRAQLMRIMASQLANRVGSINPLPSPTLQSARNLNVACQPKSSKALLLSSS